jgi:hypothetical protein
VWQTNPLKAFSCSIRIDGYRLIDILATDILWHSSFRDWKFLKQTMGTNFHAVAV